ncbi:MAG: hypothetical protein J7L22_03095 [Candidatus Marinimicrobia bacterium]|nr:hypothetical protein [Candidatus Neomarinimicrobiota bacterium]
MEDLVCPECGASLKEEDLRKALVCKNCKTKLRDPKYIDFLELLVYNDVVDDIDFFDMSLYGDEILKDEREDYDEPDIDPAKFEKRKEVWDEFEDDIELKEGLHDDIDIEEDAWDIIDPEVLEEDEFDEDYDDSSKKDDD